MEWFFAALSAVLGALLAFLWIFRRPSPLEARAAKREEEIAGELRQEAQEAGQSAASSAEYLNKQLKRVK